MEPNLVANVIEAEKVGSNERVDIVVQLSRAPHHVVYGKSAKSTGLDGDWSGVRRYCLTQSPSKKKIKSQPVASSDAPPNHGSSHTLSDFLRWGMENYPARHYMVVIGDHGQGFAGTGFDYLHKDVLDPGELKEALAQSPVKPDVVMMDACEMGAVEIAYQIREQAGILIASEEIIGLGGLPHRQLLEYLQQNPHSSPTQLARQIVSIASEDTINSVDRGKDPATEQLAALRLDRTPAMVESIADLGKALAKSKVSGARLKEIIGDTQSFNLGSQRKPDCDYRDLGHFATLLQDECDDPVVQEAAALVRKTLKAVVLENHCSGEEVSDGNGLSVYLPPHAIEANPKRTAPNGKSVIAISDFTYEQTDFDQATGWSKWLRAKLK
ncbi:hypothetical protein IV102_23335 [bacterium]|nr:hypothetical protein [bacterium]